MELTEQDRQHNRMIIWALDAKNIRAITEKEDGTIEVLAEIFRPGRINQFMATKEMIKATFDRWNVDLVDTHDADITGMATHIGGKVTPHSIEEGTGAMLATIETIAGPLGEHFAALFKAHKESVDAGERPIVTLSIGAVEPVLRDGVGPGISDAPWDTINAQPDHVMVVRAGYQAQPNAGLRGVQRTPNGTPIHATLGDALEYHFIHAQRSHISQLLIASIIHQSRFDDSLGRETIIANMALTAGITSADVQEVLDGSRVPIVEELMAYAMVLWVSLNDLIVATWASGGEEGTEPAEGSAHLDDDDDEDDEMKSTEITVTVTEDRAGHRATTVITGTSHEPRDAPTGESTEMTLTAEQIAALEAKAAQLETDLAAEQAVSAELKAARDKDELVEISARVTEILGKMDEKPEGDTAAAIGGSDLTAARTVYYDTLERFYLYATNRVATPNDQGGNRRPIPAPAAHGNQETDPDDPPPIKGGLGRIGTPHARVGQGGPQ